MCYCLTMLFICVGKVTKHVYMYIKYYLSSSIAGQYENVDSNKIAVKG